MRTSLRYYLCLLFCAAPSVVFAGDSEVAVKVGTTELTSSDLEARLRELPDYQLESLGSTPAAVKKAFVERVVVPELLYAEEARRRKLNETLPMQIATREVLRWALQRELQNELSNQQPVSDEEVARYYEKHRTEYEKPFRLRLFRILLTSEEKAREILDKAQSADLLKWRELAREHSEDTATKERGGDLGFVHPDGSTDVPRVRVEASLFQAATEVENGQLVPEPVREGKHFAVIWRRGSLDATGAGLEEVRPHIRRLLEQARVDDALGKIVTTRPPVDTENVDLLEALTLPVFGSNEPKAPLRISTPPQASARPKVEPSGDGAR